MSELAYYLTNRATVYRPLPNATQDQTGAPKKTWKTAGELDGTPMSSIACRVRPIDARMEMRYAQRQIRVTHRVYFGRVLPVKRGDRLETTGDDGGTERVLLVQGIFDTDDLGRVFVVDCEEQLE